MTVSEQAFSHHYIAAGLRKGILGLGPYNTSVRTFRRFCYINTTRFIEELASLYSITHWADAHLLRLYQEIISLKVARQGPEPPGLTVPPAMRSPFCSLHGAAQMPIFPRVQNQKRIGKWQISGIAKVTWLLVSLLVSKGNFQRKGNKILTVTTAS